MGVAKLKKELHAFIENTQDEALLQLLKEDFLFYNNVEADVTGSLKTKQLHELRQLAQEPDIKDTITHTVYKKATQKWRNK